MELIVFICLILTIVYGEGGYSCDEDIGPDDNSCSDQANWGKCSESWMIGYCCTSCTEACESQCSSSSSSSSSSSQYSCDDDISPDDNTCSDQASWNKCNEDWMSGYCCSSCPDACSSQCGITYNTDTYDCNNDISPSNEYTCSQHSGWDQCNEDWMSGFCCSTCGSNSCSSCSNSDDSSNGDSSNEQTTGFLSIDTDRYVFKYNGNDVFLNGANQPWVNYGNDFGGGRSDDTQSLLVQELKRISDAGGNVVRQWVFCEAKYLPIFNNDGTVQKSDSTESMADDIREYLDAAAEYNIFVILTLWNGAVDFNGNALHGILVDDSGNKLQTFIDNVLTPLVDDLKDHSALGAWEIINEPEGSIKVTSSNSNSNCEDTSFLSDKGPPWTDVEIYASQFQTFINKQAAAIHNADSKALVTVGAWSEWTSTDVYGKNLWGDSCLIAAGGMADGYLDFYQIHSYAHENKYNDYSPFRVSNKDVYQLDKPVIIGELGIKEGGGENPTTMKEKYEYIYNAGFDGALAWAMNDYSCDPETSDGWYAITKGIEALSGKYNVGVAFNEDDSSIDDKNDGLNTTEVVLIVLSVLICMLCIVFIIGFVWYRKKKNQVKHVEDTIIKTGVEDTPQSQPKITAEVSEEIVQEIEVDVNMETYDQKNDVQNEETESV